MRVEAVLLCWVIGCAGKASHSVRDEEPGVAGAAAAANAGRGGGAEGGSAASSGGAEGGGTSFGGLSLGGSADFAGAAGSGGSSQCSAPPSCGIEGESYVLVEDGPSAAPMASPIDDTCARCRVPCEGCAKDCEVNGTGIGSCGSVRLNIAVCAGAGQVPPCLNTVAEPPYYIDPNGERWPVVSLSGGGDALTSSRTLEGALTLVLRDGSDVRVLPTVARMCVEVSRTLAPCKKIDQL